MEQKVTLFDKELLNTDNIATIEEPVTFLPQILARPAAKTLSKVKNKLKCPFLCDLAKHFGVSSGCGGTGDCTLPCSCTARGHPTPPAPSALHRTHSYCSPSWNVMWLISSTNRFSASYLLTALNNIVEQKMIAFLVPISGVWLAGIAAWFSRVQWHQAKKLMTKSSYVQCQ